MGRTNLEWVPVVFVVGATIAGLVLLSGCQGQGPSIIPVVVTAHTEESRQAHLSDFAIPTTSTPLRRGGTVATAFGLREGEDLLIIYNDKVYLLRCSGGKIDELDRYDLSERGQQETR